MTQSPSLPELPKPRLLACPFCSGEGRETKEADSDWPSKCFMFIQCTRCGARTANVYGSGDPSEWADARHNWNQRLACYEAGSAAAAQAAPEGFVLVRVEKLKHAHQQAKLAADLIVWFAKDNPGKMCGYLDDSCSAASIAAEDIESMLAAAPTQGAEGAAPQAVPTMQQISDYLHRLDKIKREVVEREARSLHASSDAQAVVRAWMHEDGRVVPATTKADAERDGGAMKSSLSGYTIPLFRSQAVVGEAGEQISLAHLEAYRHVANEWADMAINGWQHAHNLADGISEAASVRDNMDACLAYCRKVNTDTFAKFPMPALTPSPTPTAPQEADALREALKTARDHIEMDALEISHPTDAARIRAALAQHQPQQGEQHG